MKMKIINTLVILALVLSLPVIVTRSAFSPGAFRSRSDRYRRDGTHRRPSGHAEG